MSCTKKNVRIDIRNSCLSEQYYLCAYCCDRITISASHNEHIIPQKVFSGQNLTLDYSNIVASCQSNNHCGHKKQNHLISVTPFSQSCENDIIYQLKGKMTHRNQSAQSTISVLNLRDKGLANKRKNIIDIILFQYIEDLNNLALEDFEYLEMVMNEIIKPDLGDQLEAFAPVIVNVLHQYLFSDFW